MYHSTCVTHVPWCMSRSLNHGKNVPGTGNPQFCVFGKMPMVTWRMKQSAIADSQEPEVCYWYSRPSFSYQIFVHSWTKVYKFFFSVICKTHRKWKFLEFLELGFKPYCFFLNKWNIVYLGPVVTIKCPKQWAIFHIYDVDLDLDLKKKMWKKKFRQYLNQ